jgi:hypothetical protein
MFVAVMPVMVVGILSAVSLVLDEEEYMVNVQSAAEVIASCLVLHRSKRRSAGAGCRRWWRSLSSLMDASGWYLPITRRIH